MTRFYDETDGSSEQIAVTFDAEFREAVTPLLKSYFDRGYSHVDIGFRANSALVGLVVELNTRRNIASRKVNQCL